MTHVYENSGNDVVICRVGNIPEHGTSLHIKVDIWHPAVGLRCRNPPRHLSQLKPWAIPLIWTFGFFGGALYISHKKLPTDGKVLSHLGFNSKVCPGLKWLDIKVLQRNAMLWDIPYSKNINVIPGISVFIGHTSRP